MIVAPKEEKLGYLQRGSTLRSWPAVWEDQWRLGKVLATHHHPLIEAAKMKIADLRDAAQNEFALLSTGRIFPACFISWLLVVEVLCVSSCQRFQAGGA